ncbi:hypothetical protein NFI96_027425 [Prochilodus magdalenae]|nr:hypothetical protein NFI96_027425 [Prochilodus magdalenae]
MEWAHQRFSHELQSGCGKQDGRPGAEQGRSEIPPEDWCDSGLDSFLDAECESVPERQWSRGFPLDCGGVAESQTGECVSLGGGERLDSAIGDSITDEAAVESLSAGIRTVQLAEAEERQRIQGGGGPRAGEEERMSEELWRTLSFVSEDGDTALHLALIHEQWGFVQYLLDLIGLNRSWTPYLDIQNDLGQTALHLAVIVDRSECVSALLQAGACAKLQERGGHTPLHLAVREQRTECVRALTSCSHAAPDHLNITNYAESPVMKFQSPKLHVAFRSAQEQCVELHGMGGGVFSGVTNHASPSGELMDKSGFGGCQENGVSALHVAVQKGRCDLVSMLLKAGANVNQRDQGSGRTPLHWAVESQSCAVVDLLLKNGATVDQRSYAGHTPLYCALYRPNTELQALLKSASTSSTQVEDEDEEEYDDDEDEERESEEEEFDDVVINGQRVL